VEYYFQEYFYFGGDRLETRLNTDSIQIARSKNRFKLMIPLILLLLVADKMNGAALPNRRSIIGLEQVFKFETDIVTQALLKTGFSVHLLKKNETLYSISQRYYVSVVSLMEANQIIDPHSIPVGRRIYVPPADCNSGRLQRYRVNSEDTVEELISRFGLEPWQFDRLNPGLRNKGLKEGMLLFLPVKEVGGLSREGIHISLIKPVRGRLTSRFGRRWGRMHMGIDLAAPLGTPVRTGAAGRVVFTGWNGGYGRFIKIDHGKYQTNYGHLSKILISKGSNVQQGDLIGLVGATGRAYGSHLHFELEINGKKIDPLLYLR
jgi:murein DD-endopeptidase MepM/ murein hydrolase activator NlpD